MVKKNLCYILKLLSRATLWRYQPRVVGITGSVGKSSAKDAVFDVLKTKFNVRKNQKNYNNEIGVPLTILGYETAGRSILGWLKIFIGGSLGIIYTKNYPEILVLEMGADRINDIKYLTDFVKCTVGVVTAIGDIPAHLEYFQSAGQVAREKANLIKSLDKDGWAVLNYDDERVRAMAGKTAAQVLTYGFSEDAALRAENVEQRLEDIAEAGLSFKVDYKGSNVPVRLKNVFGRHQIYSVLAAIAVGLTFKMNLVEIVQGLADYQSPKGRLKLIKGIKNSWLIDDTYNAAPIATLAALETLNKMPGRKIAVLGDMLELGPMTEEAHRRIGRRAAAVVSLLLGVGERSIFMVDEAKKAGLDEDKIFHFASSDQAGRVLQDMIRKNDVVLIKGSQGTRMERVVKEVMAEPQKAEDLLVRQGLEWGVNGH